MTMVTTVLSNWCKVTSTGSLYPSRSFRAERVPVSICRRSFTSTCTPQNVSSTTQRGTELFFDWLERRFGGQLPMTEDTPENPQVVITSQLTSKDLQRLFHHEITVLQVRNFYPKASAIQLGKELAEQSISQRQHQQSEVGDNNSSQLLKNWKVSTARGLESSDVFTLGAHLPYNIAIAKGDDGIEEYFNNVATEFRERRRRKQNRKGLDDEYETDTEKANNLWPLDQLRLELDEIWPHGAGLRKEKRRDTDKISTSSIVDSRTRDSATRTMGGGLPRIMMGPTRWSKGFVHVDELAPLSTDSGLFTANIYLQLPNSSPPSSSLSTDGSQQVLEIWPLAIRNRWDWYRVRAFETYTQESDDMYSS
jgi:hypothetical protein